MPDPVLIATIMRPEGETGVQTHFRSFMAYLRRTGQRNELMTPYCAPLWQVYPIFGLGKLVNLLDRERSVWWYRHWHAYFLRQALRRRLQTGEACVVYAQCPLSAHAALSARMSKNQRVVMVTHFNISQADEWVGKGLVPQGGWLYRAIQDFETDVLPRLDGLVFVSAFMRQELERRIPALVSVPARVIPNFLDDPGEPATVTPQADLITVGTLEYRKNQRYALDIVHAAKQQGHRLTLTVVGDGPDRAMLEARAAELGIDGQVHFVGFVAKAADRMPAHRACLHVAHMENLPLTLIEALSRGLPVFAPQAGGMPEVFEDGIQGSLIPLDDAAQAARLIVHWLDDAARMAEVRGLARRRFLDRFEASRGAAQLANFLDDQNQSDATDPVARNEDAMYRLGKNTC